jgi:hypothetical protein
VARRTPATREAAAPATGAVRYAVGTPRHTPSRGGTLLALSVAAVWVVALATLALTAANPIVLNRTQVRQADLVVSARVIDLSSGECAVEDRWSVRPAPPTIRVVNLPATRAEAGGTYILPLVPREEGVYEVIPAPLEGAPRLVYPASPDVVAQVEELLGRHTVIPVPTETGE